MQESLERCNGDFAVVEDAGGQRGVGVAQREGVGNVVCRAGTARGNDGYVQRRRIWDAHGRLTEVEYTILEKPVPPPESEPPPKQENPVLEKPEQVLPKQAEPEQENPAQLNTMVYLKTALRCAKC